MKRARDHHLAPPHRAEAPQARTERERARALLHVKKLKKSKPTKNSALVTVPVTGKKTPGEPGHTLDTHGTLPVR